jgi:hypothetical protein
MSADSLTIETFVEYGIGMIFLAVRLYARLTMGGLRGLQIDDVFAVAAMVLDFSLRYSLILSDELGTDILDNADGDHLSPG